MTIRERMLSVNRPRFGLILICLLGLAFLWLGMVRPVSAAISLIYFRAIPGVGQVRLEWATATELDCFGYYIQRSLSEDGAYERISPLLPCQGDPLSGWTYFWNDGAVVNGTTYWYRLEAIDTSQNSDFYGPESATPNTIINTPTPTSTPNGTLTPTLTRTATLPATASPTPSATSAPTDAIIPTSTATLLIVVSTPGGAYPAPAIPTSPAPGGQIGTPTVAIPVPTQPSPIPNPTQTITATATLLPLPDITPEFPAGGIVVAGRETPTVAPVASEAQAAVQSAWYPGGAILLTAVLVLIWSLLGVWFYFSLRQLD